MSKFKTLNQVACLLNKHKLLIIALVLVSFLSINTVSAERNTGAPPPVVETGPGTVSTGYTLTVNKGAVSSGSSISLFYNTMGGNTFISPTSFPSGTAVSVYASIYNSTTKTYKQPKFVGCDSVSGLTNCNITMNGNKTITVSEDIPVVTTPPSTTPTRPDFSASSVYILGASSKDYLLPFAGFGASILPDSCLAYPKAKTDLTAINNLLKAQATKQIGEYFASSCNTTTSPTCDAKIDTINNLLLTYTTYKVEAYKLLKNQQLTCTTAGQPIANTYKKTWYNIDFVAMTYASVKSLYSTKFTGNPNFISKLDSTISTNFNNAVLNDKFTNITSATTLWSDAKNAFKVSTSPVVTIVNGVKVTAAPISTTMIGSLSVPTLSTGNAFLFFGLTNNRTDKTIGAIPMTSLSQYVSLYDANPTRFGDIYNTTNRPLFDAGESILMNINSKIDLRLPPDESTMATTNTIVQATPTPSVSQTASVINSIGNWFKNVWGSITGFFGGLFKTKEAGAAVSGITYPSCPGLVGDPPKTYLKLILDKVYGLLLYQNNLFVMDKEINETIWDLTVTLPPSPRVLPTLENEDYRYLIREKYISDNTDSNNGFNLVEKPILELNDEGKAVINEILKKEQERFKKIQIIKNTFKVGLSTSTEPYNCTRNLNRENALIISSNGRQSFIFEYFKYSGTILEQNAQLTVSTKILRDDNIKTIGVYKQSKANNVRIHFFNKKNKITNTITP